MRVKLYAVNYWGSKPGTDDDCWCGYDFESKKEALEQYNAPVENPYCKDHTAYIEIDGPGLSLERRNPDYKKVEDSQDDWKQEAAMQAGMAFGCDGYNDMMGYSLGELEIFRSFLSKTSQNQNEKDKRKG